MGGCCCHEHLLKRAGLSWPQRLCNQNTIHLASACVCNMPSRLGVMLVAIRLSLYRRESEGCMWKGRRMIEMACGRIHIFRANIRESSTPKYRSYLAGCSVGLRATLAHMEETIKVKLQEALSAKFSYFQGIPYGFLAAFGHERSEMSIEQCRQRVAELLAERDRVIAAGDQYKLHRVTMHLACGQDNPLRQQLEVFAAGGVLGAEITYELRLYAFGSIVSRKVEGVHARVKKWQNKKDVMKPSLLNPILKRAELSLLLDNPSFFIFACGWWTRRKLANRVLSFVVPMKDQWKINSMTWQGKVGLMYLFDPESQYRDVTEESVVLKQWTQVAGPSLVPEPSALPSACVHQMVTYLKSKLPMGDCVWSLPSGVFNRLAHGPTPEDWCFVRGICVQRVFYIRSHPTQAEGVVCFMVVINIL